MPMTGNLLLNDAAKVIGWTSEAGGAQFSYNAGAIRVELSSAFAANDIIAQASLKLAHETAPSVEFFPNSAIRIMANASDNSIVLNEGADYAKILTELQIDGPLKMVGSGLDFAVFFGADADVNLYRDPSSEALKTDDDFKFADDKSVFVGKDADGSLPTANSVLRGKLLRVEGGEGAADKVYCCMKKADDTYTWVQVASG